ncbi:putative leucine-rich repeat domain superfamily [Helianthus annuus]|nr:putative leucine-rich repeat domain superfamily [Helianthus annuus]
MQTNLEHNLVKKLCFLIVFVCFLVKDLVFLVGSCWKLQRCLLWLITEVMMNCIQVDHYAQKIRPDYYQFTVHLANVKESAIHTFFSSNKKRSHQSKSSQTKSSTKSSDVAKRSSPKRIGCVSNRWLTVLSNVRASEMVHGSSDDVEMVQENDGFLTRCLDGKKATDCRLQSVAVGTSARGGLGKLSVRGSNKVTKLGFTAIARGCPSLKVLSLWNGIAAIAENCPNLSSLTIESCKNIGNESLQAVARHCPNLQSITIKDCPNVGDQGVATLLSSLSSVLKKVKLQSLNITDFSLAVIGHYGKSNYQSCPYGSSNR